MDWFGWAARLRDCWASFGRECGGAPVVSVAQLAQAPGVALSEAPCAVSLVVAAELVALGRVVAGCGAVAHGGQFAGGEELKLPHGIIIPDRLTLVLSDPFLDHANLSTMNTLARN
nr:hypothetical protein GCM10020092_070670 [Actinoplanes digitatis]